ncbi:ribokinase [Pectinatus brassicae]|uniref:Ribokinase n=1 Tax=Pectinatus brassicae TaxID=862415 RepID=A0A840UN48_9FIRM|nr:ribokinase [Pectinatus brassicae]MBB5335662.1 ribokinase [Pectinatus brassicae]
MANKIVIMGSLNLDTIIKINRMPVPGETLSTDYKANSPGGKGANQAVAAARAGSQTSFIGKIGKDQSGDYMLNCLKQENIDTAAVVYDDNVGTGAAEIFLYPDGQNSILVYGGSNQTLSVDEVDANAEKIAAADFLIAQFEIPQEAILAGFKIAKQNNVKTVLNPAPAQNINPEIIKLTDILIPNETESETLTGIKITDIDSMSQTRKAFAKMGVDNIIVTVGSRGAYYATKNADGFQAANKVQAVDTTAAGDTFIGALTAKLDKSFNNLAEAISFAQKASAITVQRVGAQPSIPTLKEITDYIAQSK